jgi:hypothetical protein
MRCDPANSIITRMGGLSAVAEITGVTPHSVMRWRMPKADGGTGGLVPSKHAEAILSAARDRGVDLSPQDFFQAEPERVAS